LNIVNSENTESNHNADDVLRSLPEKFWDVAGWNNQGWSPVSVDGADRKRIVQGILAVTADQSDGYGVSK
jgi:hypothetical protein